MLFLIGLIFQSIFHSFLFMLYPPLSSSHMIWKHNILTGTESYEGYFFSPPPFHLHLSSEVWGHGVLILSIYISISSPFSAFSFCSGLFSGCYSLSWTLPPILSLSRIINSYGICIFPFCKIILVHSHQAQLKKKVSPFLENFFFHKTLNILRSAIHT